MIDIHPPHHAATTRRDFFIHLATVVLGILIAIGLEQTVEYFHHSHQLAEARNAIETERRMNINRFAVMTDSFHNYVPILRTNLAIFLYLKKHPGAPPSEWPGVLDWNTVNFTFYDTAWTSAQQNNVLAYMPEAEVRRDADLYRRLGDLNKLIGAHRAALDDAFRFSVIDPDPSHLSPEQIDREIDLISQALLAFSNTALAQTYLSRQYPDFSPAPSRADSLAIRHLSDITSPTNAQLRDRVYNFEKAISSDTAGQPASPAEKQP